MTEKKDRYIPTSGPMPRPESPHEAAKELADQAFKAPMGLGEITFHTKEFTSVCPKTGQPDYGEVEICYVPSDKCLESKSVKFYLWSYREHGAYTETLAFLIARDVMMAISPRSLRVTVTQYPRGGVGLKAVATLESLQEALEHKPYAPHLDPVEHEKES